MQRMGGLVIMPVHQKEKVNTYMMYFSQPSDDNLEIAEPAMQAQAGPASPDLRTCKISGGPEVHP
jgi:hypothetical protein